MSVHKQSSNGQPTKPLLPALSSRFRATKSPITPKLAGSLPTSPALFRTSPDRNTRPNIASIAREDISPLSANITPRSGNRRSRIGTDSPATPSAGARRTRAVSGSKASGEERVMNGPGLGISSPGIRPFTTTRVLQSNANSASSPNLSRRISAAKSGIGSEDSLATSPFFHADDAKSSISSYNSTDRPTLSPKDATFFYVGSGSNTASPDPNRSNSSGSPRPDTSKFFHANDLPEPSLKIQPPRPTLNKKKSSASIGSPRLLPPPDPQRQAKSPSRPASPLKETYYRSAPPTLPSSPKKPTTTPALTTRVDAARRTSVGSNASTPRQTLHKKSSSINIPNAAGYRTPTSPKPKHMPLPELQLNPRTAQRHRLSRDMTPPEAASPRSTSITSTSALPAPGTAFPPSEPVPITSPTQIPHKLPDISPSKPPPTPAQEAANNARRERKVLDLEISNSSLLAINRTLEREMRKQHAELRRFRRLSRSGRLSIRTVSGQSKSSLGILAEDGEEDEDAQALLQGLDSMDLGDSDDEPSSDEDSNSPTASESASTLSSTHALKQRKRDEKRLMLDLSKHRQLLIDSEKMNSSIRRCLAWSEEMIKDGQKALDHQVRIGDVKLGGRVLDHDSDDERGMGLVSPSKLIGNMEADRLWADARNEAINPLDGLNGMGKEGNVEVFDDL